MSENTNIGSENFIFPLKINIKQEPLDDDEIKKNTKVQDSNITVNETVVEKKIQLEPIKSSNEILAELFKVFNSEPPQYLLDDNNVTVTSATAITAKHKHKKHKKEKKHKKKSKKKNHSDDENLNEKKENLSKEKEKEKEKELKSERKKLKKSLSSNKSSKDKEKLYSDNNNSEHDEIMTEHNRKHKKSKKHKKPDKLLIKTEQDKLKLKDTIIKQQQPEEQQQQDKEKLNHLNDEEISKAKNNVKTVQIAEEALNKVQQQKQPQSSQIIESSLSVLKPGKIIIKNLKNSTIIEDSTKQQEEEERLRNEKQKEDGEHTESSNDDNNNNNNDNDHNNDLSDHNNDDDDNCSSILSLSDEETYQKEKRIRYYEDTNKYLDKTKSSSSHRDKLKEDDEYRKDRKYRRSRSRDYKTSNSTRDYKTLSRRSSRDRDYDNYSRYNSNSNRYSRSSKRSSQHDDRRRAHNTSRSRSRSRSNSRSDIIRTKIDKKRLLEIARKNAINMLKSGALPGTQNLAPDIKEKALAKMRYGGKTIEELTNYCQQLSNGEALGDLSSVSDDNSDHDREGKERAFNHPFVLKERGPIVMNIKNSVPIAPKSAEQTKAILMQYPVSSGQEHRLNESGWVPVPPKKPEPPPKKVQPQPIPAPIPPPPPLPIALLNSSVIIQKTPPTPFDWLKSKPIPQEFLQQTPPPPQQQQKLPIQQQPNIQPQILPSQALQQPSVQINEQQNDIQVFPESSGDNLDISTIITQRLNAMRKLQDNPNDTEARELMTVTQKDMSSWATSKFTPGQFTGTTGANILSVKQLSSGFTAWAKKDQLLSLEPVSGGMGMHLLQKMGWKPGEGLGKDKSGSLQPLLLEVKLDKKGLYATEENKLNAANNKNKKKLKKPIIKTLEGKHPVSLLGELAAKRKWGTPSYDVVVDTGPGHNKCFLFKVIVNGMEYQPTTTSNNKKDAKSTAAKFCLQKMGILTG